MAIRIILYQHNREEKPPGKDKTIYDFPNDQLTIGSKRECDIHLSDIDPFQISISKGRDTAYSFNTNFNKVPVSINKQKIDSGSAQIKNGDSIQIGDYSLQFSVAFERVEHHRKIAWITYLSAAFILLILILETGIIVILPKQVAKRQLWGLEVKRQQTVELLDVTRSRCAILVPVVDGNLHRETINLIEQELDSIAIYLRKFIDDLNATQINEIYLDVQRFENILNDVQQGDLFPEEETIHSDFYLQKMIKAIDSLSESKPKH